VRAHKPAIRFIFITLLLDVMGFGLLIPVGPKLVRELSGGNEQAGAHYFGLLAATYAAMQFIFAPTLGALSDHFGRRPVLLFSLLGSGLDYFALALSPNLAFLYVTRAINGLTGGSMTVASAYIADVTPPEKRAAGFGLVGAAFGLGFVIGPLLGGVLGRHDIRWPFYAAGALTLANWLYGCFVVPESLPPERRAKMTFARSNPIGVFAGLARYPLVAWMSAALFLLNLAQFSLHSTWVLYTGHRYGWDAGQVGWSLFAVGIGAAVVQAGLARRLIPALGEKTALMLGLLLGVMSYAGYGAATQGWMIYAVIAVGSLGGIAGPAAQSLITRSVRPDEQGAVQGAITGLQSVAAILGPLIGTSIFAYAIRDPWRDQHVPGLSFYASALLAALGWLVAGIAVTKRHEAEDPAAVQPAVK
jgi:DHA1 family tetracycline resistance protein-like MFS transporter